MVRSAARRGDGEDQRELVQEIWVGVGKVEGDRAGRVIGDDPCGQVAAPRILAAAAYRRR
jgi:hypothetical protein